MNCSVIVCISVFVLLIAAVLIFVNLPAISTVIKQRGGAITWHDYLLTTEPENGQGMDKHLKYIAHNALRASREYNRILIPAHEYSKDITVLNRILRARLSYEQQLSKSMVQPSTFEPDMVVEPMLNRRVLIEFDEGNDFHEPLTDLRYAAKQQEYYSHILSDRNDMLLLRITYRKGLHASDSNGIFKLDGTGIGDNAIRTIVEYVVSRYSDIRTNMRRPLVLVRLNIRRERLISIEMCSFTKDELSASLRAAYRKDGIIISMDELFDAKLDEKDRSDFYVTINGLNVTITMRRSNRTDGGSIENYNDLDRFIKEKVDIYTQSGIIDCRCLRTAEMNKLLTKKDTKDICNTFKTIIDSKLTRRNLFNLYDPRTSRYESYWSISDYKEKIANDEYINKYKQLKDSIANSSSYSDNAKSFILSILLLLEYAVYTDDWWYGPQHPEDDLRDWFKYDSPEQILCDLPWILNVKGNLERYNRYLVPYVHELWDTVAEEISMDEWYSCRAKK